MSGNNDPTIAQGTGDRTPGTQVGERMPPAVPGVELVAAIGRGGMGTVWKGTQPFLGRTVAVKFLLAGADPADLQWSQRFQREARLLAGLQHPHIVGCYQADVATDGTPWLVMEFIDGPTLRAWIDAHGPLPIGEALRIAAEVARALHHAHLSGIIHRDVKPENVLLAKSAAHPFPFSAKLADLGLARPEKPSAEAQALTRQGAILGTPSTMAPEQFDDPEGVDHRADIYGLGCVLYHALAAAPAFNGQTMAQIVGAKLGGKPPDVRALRAEVPPAVAELVARLLAKDRGQRPQTYREIWENCERLRSAVETGVFRRRGPRRIALPILLGTGALAAVAWLGLRSAPRPAAAAVPVAAAAPAVTPVQSPVATVQPLPAAVPVTPPLFRGPLWELDQTRRLTAWTVHGDARWVSDEEREDAISGLGGTITRPLPPGLQAVRAGLRLTNGETKTDDVAIGFVLADGTTAALAVKNLGQGLLASLDVADAVEGTWKAAAGPRFIAGDADGVLDVQVRMNGRSLRAGVAGRDLDLDLPLAAEPVRLLLHAAGRAPATVIGLRAE